MSNPLVQNINSEQHMYSARSRLVVGHCVGVVYIQAGHVFAGMTFTYYPSSLYPTVSTTSLDKAPDLQGCISSSKSAGSG